MRQEHEQSPSDLTQAEIEGSSKEKTREDEALSVDERFPDVHFVPRLQGQLDPEVHHPENQGHRSETK